MIDGVMTKKLKVIPDERGRLMECLRNDDDLFVGFGQFYMTTTFPGVVIVLIGVPVYYVFRWTGRRASQS